MNDLSRSLMNPDWKKGCDIIESFVRDMWKKGYVFSVFSEECAEIEVTADQDIEEVIKIATDLEISWICLYDTTDNMLLIGSVMFIPENGNECISDYSDNGKLIDLVTPYVPA